MIDCVRKYFIIEFQPTSRHHSFQHFSDKLVIKNVRNRKQHFQVIEVEILLRIFICPNDFMSLLQSRFSNIRLEKSNEKHNENEYLVKLQYPKVKRRPISQSAGNTFIIPVFSNSVNFCTNHRYL